MKEGEVQVWGREGNREEEKADSKEKGVNCVGVFDSSVLMLGYWHNI